MIVLHASGLETTIAVESVSIIKLVGGRARKMKLGPSSAHKYVDFNAQSMKKMKIIILLPALPVSLWHCGDLIVEKGEKRQGDR